MKKLLKITALLVALTMLGSLYAGAETAQAEQATAPQTADPAAKTVSKDETVYANLGQDGGVDSVYIVSRIDTPEEGAVYRLRQLYRYREPCRAMCSPRSAVTRSPGHCRQRRAAFIIRVLWIAPRSRIR